MAMRAKGGRRGKTVVVPPADPLLTYPVGVLIRDESDKIYYLSLAQLDRFRRRDLEDVAVRNQMQAGDRILGLKNAWLIEGFGIKSGQ